MSNKNENPDETIEKRALVLGYACDLRYFSSLYIPDNSVGS